jgi:hypothetical protein
MPPETKTPDFYIQMDSTPADILLADLSSPHLHIYVVIDEFGRYVTYELNEVSLPQNDVGNFYNT